MIEKKTTSKQHQKHLSDFEDRKTVARVRESLEIIQNFGVTSQNLKAYYMFDPVGHVDDHCYNCWM